MEVNGRSWEATFYWVVLNELHRLRKISIRRAEPRIQKITEKYKIP